ncbi:MAG: phage major capsid protein [Actinomycetota bacterium]
MLTIEEILAALQEIITGATAEGGEVRPLTDDEVSRYEDLELQLATARRDIEVRSRNSAYNTPTRSDLHIAAGGVDTAVETDQDRAFRSYIRTGTPNSDLEYRAQSEGTGAAGGYLVPEGFRNNIIERLKKIGGLSAEVEHVPTSTGNPLPWPTEDDTANEGEIVAENALAVGGADKVFGVKTLGAYKYESLGVGAEPLKVSFELAQDSAFDLEAFVERNLARRIGRRQAKDWTGGTGVGQPQGLRTGGTTGVTITNNAAGPTLQNLIALTHVADPEYREDGESVFVMHDSILAGLEGLLDGNGRPLLGTSQDSIAGKPVQTIRGYRVVIDNTMPATWAAGSVKTVAFGNMKRAYVIRDVKEVTLIVLREMYARYGQIGYMSWARADGLVQDPNAFTMMTSAAA